MGDSLALAIGGDLMLGRLVNEAVARNGSGYPWGDILPVLRKADLFLVNLECALTTHTRRWHDGKRKSFYFRADPSVAATLKLGRVNFASLANNHIYDFGRDGLLETLATLDRAGIAHAGAGGNLAAAQTPAFLSARGVRIGVVAFADHPPAWAATATAPGINYTPVLLAPQDFASVKTALARARQQADLVVFSIHWGPNMRSRPTAQFREFARRVITAGADIFWGHSAHLVQGIEVYQKKLILYDTGDLVDDYAVDQRERNDLSALLLVRMGVPTLGREARPTIESVELAPVRISDMRVNLAQGSERQRFIHRIAHLCTEMGTVLESGPQGACISLGRPHPGNM